MPFVVPQPENPCPCGSAAPFGSCCAPLLAGSLATSPERLMRSRYTAFVVGDAEYLLATWHPGTRPDSLEPDPDTAWAGLEIVEVAGGSDGDKRGTVEFAASYRIAGASRVHVQRERSRFVRQSDRWWYLDGIVTGE